LAGERCFVTSQTAAKSGNLAAAADQLLRCTLKKLAVHRRKAIVADETVPFGRAAIFPAGC
jgi:hypothetical protein